MLRGGLTFDQEAIRSPGNERTLGHGGRERAPSFVSSAECVQQNETSSLKMEKFSRRTNLSSTCTVSSSSDCASTQCIDWNRCTSNDLWEVYGTLGIEACVHVLFDQLKTVVSFDGTYVADQHLIMITDTICRGGVIMPLNRHGINKTDVSPLMRCSFEETADVLFNAAIHSEHENAKGVTSSIMMGQSALFGTGGVSVMFPWRNLNEDLEHKLGEKRILRSTCRSYISDSIAEDSIEYICDDVRPSANRSLQMHTDGPLRMRAKFRHSSPPKK